ncbi:hypothetical protein BKA62DRAFT_824746 [Auriculariales sp. MPI-PUGE-AT-0066]|nr:hypothetical protein BKA62DRAFT_824746 [Auriculariales sp. MPI-PUGE-AT-0066]
MDVVAATLGESSLNGLPAIAALIVVSRMPPHHSALPRPTFNGPRYVKRASNTPVPSQQQQQEQQQQDEFFGDYVPNLAKRKRDAEDSPQIRTKKATSALRSISPGRMSLLRTPFLDDDSSRMVPGRSGYRNPGGSALATAGRAAHTSPIVIDDDLRDYNSDEDAMLRRPTPPPSIRNAPIIPTANAQTSSWRGHSSQTLLKGENRHSSSKSRESAPGPSARDVAFRRSIYGGGSETDAIDIDELDSPPMPAAALPRPHHHSHADLKKATEWKADEESNSGSDGGIMEVPAPVPRPRVRNGPARMCVMPKKSSSDDEREARRWLAQPDAMDIDHRHADRDDERGVEEDDDDDDEGPSPPPTREPTPELKPTPEQLARAEKNRARQRGRRTAPDYVQSFNTRAAAIIFKAEPKQEEDEHSALDRLPRSSWLVLGLHPLDPEKYSYLHDRFYLDELRALSRPEPGIGIKIAWRRYIFEHRVSFYRSAPKAVMEFLLEYKDAVAIAGLKPLRAWLTWLTFNRFLTSQEYVQIWKDWLRELDDHSVRAYIPDDDDSQATTP